MVSDKGSGMGFGVSFCSRLRAVELLQEGWGVLKGEWAHHFVNTSTRVQNSGGGCS